MNFIRSKYGIASGARGSIVYDYLNRLDICTTRLSRDNSTGFSRRRYALRFREDVSLGEDT